MVSLLQNKFLSELRNVKNRRVCAILTKYWTFSYFSCMQLVSNPWQFDVVVLTNLYGTIVSNLLCGLIGGPGLTSGRNLGPTYAIFEPGTRNAGSSLVGKNIANPTAMLKAGVDLLRHLDLENQADIVERSINKTLIVDEVRTADLGGSNGTSEVVENVLKHVKESTK